MNTKLLNLSKKGLVGGTVVMVITSAMTIVIGIWVISIFYNSISQANWSATANTTYTNVQTYGWNSIQLLAIGLIILAAGTILGYFGMFGGKR